MVVYDKMFWYRKTIQEHRHFAEAVLVDVMENQYGITVANKYALFLNEDEDPLEILKLQEATKSTKKSEKSKKNVPDENEIKTTSNKQSAASSGSSQKKAEKIDHFSSPTQSDGMWTRTNSSAG